MNMLNKVNYIFSREQKIKIVLLFFTTFLGGLLETIGVSAILPLVSIIINPEIVETNRYFSYMRTLFCIKSTSQFIIVMSCMIISLYVLKNLFLMWQYTVQNRFTMNANLDISARLMKCYINQDYLFHTLHNVAEINRNITNDVTSFFVLVDSVMFFFSELITCILIVTYLIVLDPLSTSILVGLLSIILAIIFKIYKNYQVKLGIMVREYYTKKSKWILQTFGGIKEIKALSRESFFYDKYIKSCQDSNKVELAINKFGKFPKYILEILFISVALVVICTRIALGTDNTRFLIVLSALAVSAMRLIPSFNRMTEYISSIMKSLPSLDNIFMDLLNQECLDREAKKNQLNNGIIKFENEIRIKNLTFEYPNTERPIFCGAEIVINKFDSVGLIGVSGAGKTTFVDIILGLLNPQNGGVYVDGVNINECMEGWHRNIGYIPQDIYLIDDTIRNNVLFGLPNKDDERVWEALNMAQIDDYVRQLPDGLDTRIGERGICLSGGQRQRIGIARALYNNPELLILDEATSALDDGTESSVMRAIEKLHGRTTLIIIAHRLSTIEYCDKVYEIGNGIAIQRK